MNRPMHVTMFAAWLTLPGLAFAQGNTSTTKGGTSPEDAVVLMTKSAKAGDLDGTFGLLIDEQGKPMKEWFASQAKLAAAINAFVDASDEAFGKDAKAPPKRVDFDLKKELADVFGGMTVAGKPTNVDAEHVNIPVKMSITRPGGKVVTREDSIKARNTKDGWKILLPELVNANPDFPASVAFMNGLRASLDRTAGLVKDKTIKGRAEAMKELEKDRPATLPGNVPLPRFLTQQG